MNNDGQQMNQMNNNQQINQDMNTSPQHTAQWYFNWELIVEQTSNAFIDLAQSPSSLDPIEIEGRMKKYTQAMQNHILNQPIDPIYVQALTSGAGKPDGVKIYDSILLTTEDPPIQPDVNIVDPNKLIVPFPTSGEMN